MFKLKTQYTHKFTVAASLTGFKLEAPSHGEDIMAFAFKELLFNPDIKTAVHEDGSDKEKEEGTFMQKVIESVSKKVIDKMGAETKPSKEK